MKSRGIGARLGIALGMALGLVFGILWLVFGRSGGSDSGLDAGSDSGLRPEAGHSLKISHDPVRLPHNRVLPRECMHTVPFGGSFDAKTGIIRDENGAFLEQLSGECEYALEGQTSLLLKANPVGFQETRAWQAVNPDGSTGWSEAGVQDGGFAWWQQFIADITVPPFPLTVPDGGLNGPGQVVLWILLAQTDTDNQQGAGLQPVLADFGDAAPGSVGLGWSMYITYCCFTSFGVVSPAVTVNVGDTITLEVYRLPSTQGACNNGGNACPWVGGFAVNSNASGVAFKYVIVNNGDPFGPLNQASMAVEQLIAASDCTAFPGGHGHSETWKVSSLYEAPFPLSDNGVPVYPPYPPSDASCQNGTIFNCLGGGFAQVPNWTTGSGVKVNGYWNVTNCNLASGCSCGGECAGNQCTFYW